MKNQQIDEILPPASEPSKIITLNEPVSVTIMRDLSNIFIKLKYAMVPSFRETAKKQLRNWDLWGPMMLCLLLSFTLSLRSASQSKSVITSVFVIMWAGSLVVYLNANFLGSNMQSFSFMKEFFSGCEFVGVLPLSDQFGLNSDGICRGVATCCIQVGFSSCKFHMGHFMFCCICWRNDPGQKEKVSTVSYRALLFIFELVCPHHLILCQIIYIKSYQISIHMNLIQLHTIHITLVWIAQFVQILISSSFSFPQLIFEFHLLKSEEEEDYKMDLQIAMKWAALEDNEFGALHLKRRTSLGFSSILYFRYALFAHICFIYSSLKCCLLSIFGWGLLDCFGQLDCFPRYLFQHDLFSILLVAILACLSLFMLSPFFIFILFFGGQQPLGLFYLPRTLQLVSQLPTLLLELQLLVIVVQCYFLRLCEIKTMIKY